MDFIQQIRWRPEIGDPIPHGLADGGRLRGSPPSPPGSPRAGPAAPPGLAGGSRGMWLLVTLLMALLCLNKQLDLQSLFTDIGRVISWKQGWYEERREFQKWFVLGVLGRFVSHHRVSDPPFPRVLEKPFPVSLRAGVSPHLHRRARDLVPSRRCPAQIRSRRA